MPFLASILFHSQDKMFRDVTYAFCAVLHVFGTMRGLSRNVFCMIFLWLRMEAQCQSGHSTWALCGVLLGCPLWVILVNLLPLIQKWGVDSLCQQVCAQTATLPPVLDGNPADDVEPGALLPLKDAGASFFCDQVGWLQLILHFC